MRRLNNENIIYNFEISVWATPEPFSVGRKISDNIKALCPYDSVKGFLYLSSLYSVLAAPLSSVKLGSIRIYSLQCHNLFIHPKFSRLKIWVICSIIEKWCGLVNLYTHVAQLVDALTGQIWVRIKTATNIGRTQRLKFAYGKRPNAGSNPAMSTKITGELVGV